MGNTERENTEHGLEWPDDELAKRLLTKDLLTNESLAKVLNLSRESQGTLAEAIISLNLLPKQVVYEELAGIHGVPFVDLETYSSDPMVVSLISEKMARELEVFPLFAIGDSLTLALASPDDITVVDRVTSVSKYNVESCLAAREDIRKAINRAYGDSGEVKELLEKMGEGSMPSGTTIEAQQSVLQSSESPVSQLVDLIVAQAVRDRASDIHIDPEEDYMKVRFRIDGILYEVPPPPKYLHPFIVSRVKVMSNMDIAESRIPQDGHFQTTIDGRVIETRVSTMPTIYGENVVIRLLDTASMGIALENLGISKKLLPKVDEIVRRPHGMLVVSGPTGSGKSTTLYAMLTKARSPERHVVTIEDPVERRMKMVSQIQVNEKAHVTFASALRSILRQDPDVLMVGEMRDFETAQLAVRGALTGHLILTTLHTNDAPGVVTRLINMEIEPFLLSSSLIGVVAQRLVRCICDKCKETYEISDTLRRRLATSGITLPDTLWRGKGCSRCRDTGYSGRIAVFELMTVTPELADLIAANVPTAQLRAQARKDGMVGMLEDGVEKVIDGITTIEEVLRVSELESVIETRPPIVQSLEEKMEVKEKEKPEVSERVSLDLDDYRIKMGNWLAIRSDRIAE